ncbi:MAG: ATP-grasp domain-containing protein [Promethearchaeota archaeon]
MKKERESVLLVGFNTRPIAQSLNSSGYDVFAVDFFGDLDLYPYVKDCFIITEELKAQYNELKNNYSELLAKFAIKMLKTGKDFNYLLICSGLDNDFNAREKIYNIARKCRNVINANNNLDTFKLSRNIDKIYQFLDSMGFIYPWTISLKEFESNNYNLKFPIILKKKYSSGGTNVYKIKNYKHLQENIKLFKQNSENSQNENKLNNWQIQEFIDGIPISCTIISNGEECKVISINRQLIGLKFLNPPKEFMYCGNIVPENNLNKKERNLIKEISIKLALKLKLKGINGFDYVLKNSIPYLMEINPRIPGSIRVSETAYCINYIDLHLKSFDLNNWEYIKKQISKAERKYYSVKFVYFAPKSISPNKIEKINSLQYVEDKTPSKNVISEGTPVCTILCSNVSLKKACSKALHIVNKMNDIILN